MLRFWFCQCTFCGICFLGVTSAISLEIEAAHPWYTLSAVFQFLLCLTGISLIPMCIHNIPLWLTCARGVETAANSHWSSTKVCKHLCQGLIIIHLHEMVKYSHLSLRPVSQITFSRCRPPPTCFSADWSCFFFSLSCFQCSPPLVEAAGARPFRACLLCLFPFV